MSYRITFYSGHLVPLVVGDSEAPPPVFSIVLFLVVLFHLQYKILQIWADGKQEKFSTLAIGLGEIPFMYGQF